MFRADVAELTLFPANASEPALRTRLGPGEAQELMTPVLGEQMVRADIPETVFLPAPADPARLAAHFEGRARKDAMAVALLSDGRVLGRLVVADRYGDIATFDEADLQLFRTLSTQASMALEKQHGVQERRGKAAGASLHGSHHRPQQVLLADRVLEVVLQPQLTCEHLIVVHAQNTTVAVLHDAGCGEGCSRRGGGLQSSHDPPSTGRCGRDRGPLPVSASLPTGPAAQYGDRRVGLVGPLPDDLQEMRTIVRRVIASRVRDPHLVDDLVQETLTKVLSAWSRIDPATTIPYAITTARNVVASTWRHADTTDRNLHRVVELLPVDRPEDAVLGREESDAVAKALTHLSPQERDSLLAHDVEGRDLASLAAERGTSTGALAAQLKRNRARLRVEYLLAMDHTDPPSPQCRPVLLALSGGDRRRQRELDVSGHLLDCSYCEDLGRPLADRAGDDGTTRIRVAKDADVVLARQAGRQLAAELGFSATDGTVIATVISEVTRNIVKFAGTGEVRIGRLEAQARVGIEVVARDAGPGIPDAGLAMTDGHSTYGGLGLGLPGCRRLMDEFRLESEPGAGTTVSMCKWRSTGPTMKEHR